MTVLLDKPLTDRQQWVLESLSVCSPVALVSATDEGDDIISGFGVRFAIEGFERRRNALRRIMKQLENIGLVGVEKTWFPQAYYPDCGPTHCNEYHIESRGRRAAISHSTYDA